MRPSLIAVLLPLLACAGVGCGNGTNTQPAPSASEAASSARPATAPSAAPTASARPSAPAKAPPGLPIPPLDNSPATTIDGDELEKLFAANPSGTVGKKFKMSGQLNSVSERPMTFGSDHALWGPTAEGVENGVYSLTFFTKKDRKGPLSSCYVDRETQQKMLPLIDGQPTTIEVEGVVVVRTGALAPCKVTSTKRGK